MKRMKDDERAYRAAIEHGRSPAEAAKQLNITQQRAEYLQRKLQRGKPRATVRTEIRAGAAYTEAMRQRSQSTSEGTTGDAELQRLQQQRMADQVDRPDDQAHSG